MKLATQSVDLNADLGEGYGPYKMGDDLAMLDIVSSANVACGFHAGDPNIMAATFQAAAKRGVAIGAHPGFADLANFGRRKLPVSPAEIERIVAYQVGAACAVAALAGHRITYVKAHGALGNMAEQDEAISRAIARGVKAVDPALKSLAIAATWSERGALAEGLDVAAEIFADRAYQPDGTLRPRDLPGAVLHDAQAISQRIIAMLQEQAIIAIDGTRIPTRIDSICLHGDTQGAVAIAATLKLALQQHGYVIIPFTQTAAQVQARSTHDGR